MYLKEKKIPKWKEKEELYKSHSFDSSLAELGKNGAFINSKEIEQQLNSPTQINELEDKVETEVNPCAAE